jgi:hypothetical protein
MTLRDRAGVAAIEKMESLTRRHSGKDQTRNLEIPGSMLRIAPE